MAFVGASSVAYASLLPDATALWCVVLFVLFFGEVVLYIVMLNLVLV